MRKPVAIFVVALACIGGALVLWDNAGPSVPYVPAPILQATVGSGYGLRWRDSTRTKLMIRRLEPKESRGQKDWSLAKSVGRIGLLSEYDLATRSIKSLEPAEWLTSSEPCNDDPAPRAWKGSSPRLGVDTRNDFLFNESAVRDRLTPEYSIGVPGRIYLGIVVTSPRGDHVAITWCTKHVSKGGIIFGGDNLWGGQLNVEFRSLKHPERRGPSVRLKGAENEFVPPTIVWTWDSSSILVVDDRNMGFWYVPCPDLSELEK